MSNRETGADPAAAEQPGTEQPAAANLFDALPLLRTGTTPPPPAPETDAEQLHDSERQGDAEQSATDPDDDEAPAAPAGVEEIDTADYLGADDPDYEEPLPPAYAEDHDPDLEDTHAWQTWLGDDEEPDDRPPPGGWAIPDYDATAPTLVDRSGGGVAAARRRLQRGRHGRGDLNTERRGRGGALALALVVGVGLVVIVGAVLINAVVLAPNSASSSGTPAAVPALGAPAPPTGSTPTGSTPAAAAGSLATAGCHDSVGPDTATGTGPGSTADAPSAILAFEHAYYVQRSGTAARAVVAPDATLPAAEVIQQGIDDTPAGTRYCARITRLPAGGGALWRLELSEQWPGTLPADIVQTVTVTRLGGRTLISAISDDIE